MSEQTSATSAYDSPFRLLAIVAASVFVSEALVMILLIMLPPLPHAVAAPVDAIVVTVMIYPILYRFMLRPMTQHLNRRRAAEAALRQMQDNLEALVQQRTAELAQANESLQFQVAERQRAEEAIRARNALLASIIESPDSAIFSVDREYGYTSFNGRHASVMKALFGAAVEIGRSLLDYHTVASDRQAAKQNLDRALSGESFVIEDWAGDDALALRFFEIAYSPVKDAGQIIGASVIARDITERKYADQMLRENEEWLRLAFEAGNLGRWRYAMTADALHFDDRARNHFGSGSNVVTQADALTRVHPDDMALLQQEMTSALDPFGRGRYAAECRVIWPDGEVHWLAVQAQVHFEGEGAARQPIQVVGISQDITARKQMEEALRRARDELEARVQERTAAIVQLSSAVEQTADTVVITDRHGVIEYVNPAFEQTTGYTRAEALGQTPRLLKSGLHDSQFYRELWQAILSGEVYFGEMTNRRKNGELFHEVKTITPIRDAQGAITHFVATGKDISDRKRVELALRQSEEKFRALFETAPVGISVLDRNGHITDVNPALERLTRIPAEGLLAGAHWSRQYIHGDGTPLLPDEFASTRAIAENQSVHDMEAGIVMEDGQIVWTLVSAAPLDLPDASVVVIAQDITERKRAEEQIELQAAAMEAAANGIVITDREGRIQWTNPAFTRISGYAAQEVLGQKTSLFKSGQHDQAYYRDLWATILSGQVWHGETINRRKDGSFYTEDQTIAPVRDAQGSVTHFVAIKQDVTEHKHAEQAIQWERAKLKSILDAMQDGVYIVTPDYDIEYINPALAKEFGPIGQRKCYAYLFGRTQVCTWCHNEEVFAGNTIIWEHDWPERGRTYELFDTPVRNLDGGLSKLAIFHDITTRKRAEAQIGRRNRELAALNTVSAAVSRSLELSEVLLSLARLLPQDLGIPSGAIFLYDEVNDQLQFNTGWGMPGTVHDAFTAIPANAFHGPRVIRDREPLLTPDVRPAAESMAALLRIARPDWQDYLCVPLVAQSRLQGVLDLFSREPAQFDADGLEFFKSLGQAVGIAIHNARLYEAEQRAHQTADTLRAASLALTQTLDLEAVVTTLLDYVEQLIPYDAANVMLLEAEEQLATRAARDHEPWEDGDQARHLACDVSTTPILQQLLTDRRSSVIADAHAQPDLAQGLRLGRARSWLGVPLIAGGNVIGLYSLSKVQPNYFTLRHMQLAEALVGQAAVAVQNARLFEQVRLGREQLQDLSRRLVEVQESERLYIARELHDEAGQALTSLMVGLRLLERDVGHPEAIKSGIAELNRLIDGVQENLHRLAMDLRPASLDHLGLVAALRQYVESLSDKHGLVVQFEAIDLGHERLPSNVETAVYRIVQEALTNVIRHAHATRVDVLLKRRGDRLAAIVEDNGSGFDVAQPQTGRLGLFGIRERAEMLGGTLLIESAEHSGTILVAEVPCAS